MVIKERIFDSTDINHRRIQILQKQVLLGRSLRGPELSDNTRIATKEYHNELIEVSKQTPGGRQIQRELREGIAMQLHR